MLYPFGIGSQCSQSRYFNVSLHMEAAEGLSFPHSYASPPILHGDVKTANILLNDNYMAKVSDFGASILVPST